MSEWIDVNKEMPELDTDVLCLTDEGVVQASATKNEWYGNANNQEPFEWYFLRLDYHGCGCCAGSDPTVTHWMPIPPLEGEEND